MDSEEIEIEMPDLADFQQEWLRDKHRFVFIEGATGTGKTFVYEAQHFRLSHAPVNLGDEYWWIDPTLAQARSVFDGLVRKLDAFGVRDMYKISQMPMSITTPTGGVMRFLTADNPDYFYGIKNVRNIIVNEFTRCRITIWDALLTVANKTGCRITLIGNYQGESSAWHLKIKSMDGDPNVRYFKTTAQRAIDAGIMPKDRMETARRALSEGMFAALYLCEGTTDPSLLVEYGAVTDLFTNSHVPEGQPALTCDIALHGSDEFVMGLWSGMILKDIEVFAKLDAKKVLAIIEGKATAYSVPRSRIVYDADGLGAYLKGYLSGGTSFQGGTVSIPLMDHKLSYHNLRSQCHFLTADRINARTMWVATEKYREQIEQEIFACLRTSGQNAAGQWCVYPKDAPEVGAKARLGRSPDKFDMMQMRMLLELQAAPKFVAGLAEQAQRKRVSFKRPSQHEGNTPFKGR